MYRVLQDFIEAWAYESAATLKMLRLLTDESLRQPIIPEGRTLGRLALHLSLSLAEMLHTAGLPIHEVTGDIPFSAAVLADLYDSSAHEAAEIVEANWTDEQLTEKIPMYGETWTKGFTLAVLINHQAHHRGQLTVLMRQAGLPVPGVYGPAAEEWAGLGLPAQL